MGWKKTDVSKRVGGQWMSFVDKFVEVLQQITDSPVKFQEACALSLLSSCIGRKMFFISISDARLKDVLHGNIQFSGKYLNLWFIMIGKSRISRKTTVVRWVIDFIKEIDEEILLPDGFTPQALVSEMSKKFKNGETRAAWMNDEVSGFFQQIRETKFMIKADAVLSKIYDGDDYKDVTIQRGSEAIKKPYLTTLLASTDVLPRFFDELMMLQGFGNRFIYCIGVRQTYKPVSSSISTQLKFDSAGLVEWLKDLYELKDAIPVSFDEKALKKYISFERNIERKIIDNSLDDIKTGYAGSLPTSVLKLACIFAISDYYPQKLSNFINPLFLVREEHVKRAIDRMKDGMSDYNKVISMMRVKKLSKPALTDESQIEMIYNIIKKYLPNEVPKTILYRETNMLQRKMEETLDTLIKQGRIEAKIVNTTGRPKTMYKVIK